MAQPTQSVPSGGTFDFTPDAGALASATLSLAGGSVAPSPRVGSVSGGSASWSLAGVPDGYYSGWVEYTTDLGAFAFDVLLTLGTPGSGVGTTTPPSDYSAMRVWVFSRLKDAFTDGLLSDQGVPSDSPTYDALDAEVGSVVRSLVARFPCVVSYDALGGEDRLSFEEAAGLLTAARLLGPTSTGGSNGDLILEKTDTTTRQFSQNNTPSNPGDRQRWEWQAERALMRIACVGAAYGTLGRSGVRLPIRRAITATDEYAG